MSDRDEAAAAEAAAMADTAEIIEAVPVAPSAGAAGVNTETTAAVAAATAEPKRKRRWWLVILVVVALLGLLAGGAEFALRSIIPNVIEQQVRQQLQLAPGHPVTAELHGSALLPALTGRVGPVEVTVPDAVVFEGIEATLHATARSMPFDPSRGRIEDAVISVTVPSRSMSAEVGLATNGLVDSGEIEDGKLVVGRSVEIFGIPISLTASLQVSVEAGDLLIEPTSVKAVGFDLSVERLRSLLGEAAAGVLDPHTVCVRDQLPTGITLESLVLNSSVLGGSATVTAAVDPDLLSNPAKQQLGVCPAS